MRRNFAQVLKEGNVDLSHEYDKLYELFYSTTVDDGSSYQKMISSNFHTLPIDIRKTCLSLNDFDEVFGFEFDPYPTDCDVDYLINFCEYIYNLSLYIHFDNNWDKVREFIINHINNVIRSIGYIEIREENFSIFVPKDNVAIAVSESDLIPNQLSYKIIAYNHHSNNGKIDGKKSILLKLAEILEGKRTVLKSVSNQFDADLFQLINSCNIRHNNTDISIKGKYHKYIAELSDKELESIYDEIYQMCLLAFMQIEHAGRKDWLKELKEKITT